MRRSLSSGIDPLAALMIALLAFMAFVRAQAPAAAQVVAVKAGRLFDAKSGTSLTSQVILINDDRLTDVGPANRIRIPAGAKVIDLALDP